jgi:hypothetical protein
MSEIVAGSVFPSSKITAESITTVPCILLPAAADEVTLLACAGNEQTLVNDCINIVRTQRYRRSYRAFNEAIQNVLYLERINHLLYSW